MIPPRYPIPAETTRVEIQVVNSRFIAIIGEARTAEEARAFLSSIRKEFPDATHHVHAFRTGYGASITEGMSDDGEPSGTAGKPALAVLRGADLGDVVLVITRYFGGTKLGTGGLVRAYTQAAQEALFALPRTERVQRRQALAEVPYALYEQVKRTVLAHHGEIAAEDFAGDVTLTLVFALEDCEGFESDLAELSAGQVPVIWLEEE